MILMLIAVIIPYIFREITLWLPSTMGAMRYELFRPIWMEDHIKH